MKKYFSTQITLTNWEFYEFYLALTVAYAVARTASFLIDLLLRASGR